jgi:hypothetical protein
MILELNCYGIRLDVNEDGGSITSDLKESIQYNHKHPDYDEPEEQSSKEMYNNMIDAIESLILAHACAGIDVSDPAYLEGIERAIKACVNYSW